MYVINPESVKNKIKLDKKIAQYFMDNGVPLLSKKGEQYYFSDSDLYKEVYSSSPLWVKWAIRLSQ